MKEELKRRLDILNKHNVPIMTQMSLRGGMQERLHRQEVIRYGANITRQRKNIKKKLSQIEQARQSEDIGVFSSQSVEVLDDFNEPVFRRIRSRRGFFEL